MTREIDLKNLDLTEIIRPGDAVVWGQSAGEPLSLVEKLVEQRKEIGHARVFCAQSYTKTLKPEHADVLEITSYCAIGTRRDLARAGVLNIIPVQLSHIPEYFMDGIIPCDVVFLQVSPPNEKGEYSFGIANDFVQFAMQKARAVIAEVNDQMPWVYCDRTLTEKDFTHIVRTSRPLVEHKASPIGPVEEAIARNVGRYIDDGMTVQIGIGAIPDAIMAGLGDRRELGIHSGLITDRIMELMQSGVMTNSRKPIDTGISIGGSLLGTQKLYDFGRMNPKIRLHTHTHIHNTAVLAQLGRYISINSAVEVDLTGAVGSEVAGGVYVGTVGGQVDFVRGSQLARGGRSVIAFPATAGNGKISKVVTHVTGPITTARSDTDVVVTEFGAAELRGQTLKERARRMIAIAHPDFREGLERDAHELLHRGT
jgi:acyl-CoA hydrolase